MLFCHIASCHVTLAILTLLTFTLIFLFSFQQATASENFKIRVWLANVKSDTDQVQLCVDVNTTFSSVCKKFDAGALKLDYNVTETPVVNAGVFNLTRTQAPLNSTFEVPY